MLNKVKCSECRNGLFSPFEFGIDTPYSCKIKKHIARTKSSFEQGRICEDYQKKEGGR